MSANGTAATVRYCRCPKPHRQVAEGVEFCADCGDRIADPLLLAVFGEVRALRREVESLGSPEPEKSPQ